MEENTQELNETTEYLQEPVSDELVEEPSTDLFSVGDKVRLVIDPPGGTPVEGVVRVVNDIEANNGEKAGKHIGVELDQLVDYGHSLDGLVDERYDSIRKISVGKGWWTIPYNLEKLS